MSTKPQKNSIVLQKPVYDSAVDCVNPATLKDAEEVRVVTKRAC
jgi:hypothetical protein